VVTLLITAMFAGAIFVGYLLEGQPFGSLMTLIRG
jgi:hypothetical protein